MLSEALRNRIEGLVNKSRVVLFMKGSRHFPQCGFSASVVRVLDELGVQYDTVNILQDQELREGMKVYSQWPTYPQLYVDGKLVGGADIVRDMHQSGELAKVLGVEIDTSVEPPKLTLSEAARTAILEAQKKEAAGEPLRIGIAPGFGYELYFDAKKDTDLVLDPTIPIVMDPMSAKRAKNLTIDFSGGGFKIENEAEPPRVRSMRPRELKQLLDAKEKVVLLDVRTDEERAIAKLDGSITPENIDDIDKDARVVVYCHHGVRSRAAAERLLQSGFSKVFNLEGGIDAWSVEVDPKVARY